MYCNVDNSNSTELTGVCELSLETKLDTFDPLLCLENKYAMNESIFCRMCSFYATGVEAK